MKQKFDFFSIPTDRDIKVAYIDPILGLVRDVSICEAIKYDKKNPGTIFIFRDGDQTLRYLNIKQVDNLKRNLIKNLVPTDPCPGITTSKECGPPTIQIFVSYLSFIFTFTFLSRNDIYYF